MALRDQPYLPLYVQDFLTDEKLIECSASTTGIYIRLMCIMHKSNSYGTILLKQKDKQTDKQIKNFALKLAKQMPYKIDEIESALNELISENVIFLNGDKISQKRMIKDNEISLIRAKAGKKGGKKTQKFAKAKSEAKTEDEYEYEDENGIEIENEIIYPFDDEDFLKYWDIWRKFKKEQFKFIYKPIGEQAALKNLGELSHQNKETAMKIIVQSISNGWKGFFALKTDFDKSGMYDEFRLKNIKTMANGLSKI